MGLMGFVGALVAAVILLLIPLIGVWAADLQVLFGVVIPYLAAFAFLLGMIYRVVKWGQAPVPFRIPTTAGQSKSLPWIKPNCIDCPSTMGGVVLRLAGEIFLFRSLFRNTKLDFREGRAYYGSTKWLWFFALVFHYSFLVVVIRHLRFFTDPVPFFVTWLENLDGFLEIGLWPFVWLPGLFISGMALLGAVTYLFLRRLVIPQIRYISLANDWFPLFLIVHIALTGILMRYLLKVDIVAVKELTMSMVGFSPKIPEGGIGVLFYVHLFQVCVLLAYFPFSKLMHAGGVFLSPTRNLINNSRMIRHVNPWNPVVKTHSYEEYEDDFREVMIEVGLPVEKETSEAEGVAEAVGEDKE